MEFEDYIKSLTDLSTAIENLNKVLIEKMGFAKDELAKMIEEPGNNGEPIPNVNPEPDEEDEDVVLTDDDKEGNKFKPGE